MINIVEDVLFVYTRLNKTEAGYHKSSLEERLHFKAYLSGLVRKYVFCQDDCNKFREELRKDFSPISKRVYLGIAFYWLGCVSFVGLVLVTEIGMGMRKRWRNRIREF